MQRLTRFVIGVFVLLVLASCSTTNPSPTPVRTIPPVMPSWTPAVSPTVAATAKPSVAPAIPTPTQVAKDECITCHTNKDSLIKNAKPEQKKEEESVGVG